jgi:hypothetical protein
MKHIISGALIASALTAISFVSPASAQATRTWVSGLGDDANPCSRTAPCKTFPGAITKTATTGEINCIDSGGFGTVTILKSITIKCQGVLGGILASGVPGVTVNLPAGSKAVLDGLDIEGLNGGGSTSTPGTIGVRMIGSGNLTIMNTVIRDFSGNGVDCVGTAGARCAILNSQILNNGGGGFNVTGAAGAVNTGIASKSYIDSNPSFAVQVTNPSVLILDGNTLLGTATAISNVGSASVTGFGNNAFNSAGTITNPITLK